MIIYVCKICGNIATILEDSGINLSCCGEEMSVLEANTVDAAVEKHVPVVTVNENETIISVGEVNHPMEEAHYIEWIVVETDLSSTIYKLSPGDEPIIRLNTKNDIKTVYAYCNLHGLWKN